MQIKNFWEQSKCSFSKKKDLFLLSIFTVEWLNKKDHFFRFDNFLFFVSVWHVNTALNDWEVEVVQTQNKRKERLIHEGQKIESRAIDFFLSTDQ